MDRIVVLGAGNLAHHLSKHCKSVGWDIVQIFNHNATNGPQLARHLGAHFSDRLEDIFPDADLYIFALKDDAIKLCAQKLKANEGLWVHCSGSVSSDVFKGCNNRYGVFYPLQTFQKGRDVDFQQVPMFYNANSDEDIAYLRNFALSLGNRVSYLSYEKRKQLHIAAVLVNNFSNHLFALAKEITDANQIDFDLLLPLIRETVQNLEEASPEANQTGPAKRGDQQVVDDHIEILEAYPRVKALYRLFTEQIKGSQK